MLVFFSILYNPEENSLNNIILAKKFDIIPVVYLNKVDDFFLKKLIELDVVVLGKNINVGLGLAFYELEEYLKLNNLEYFIYFDQDTKVKQKAWTQIIGTYENFYKINDIGLLHYGNGSNKDSRIVTSSGSLFSMSILDKVGFHDKSFFVEGVDYEFCLRLNFFGYRIYNIISEAIDHKSLQDFFTINIYFKTIKLRIYGKKRTKDFNLSHKRLFKQAFKYSDYKFFFFLLKSIIRHNSMELISRIFKEFK